MSEEMQEINDFIAFLLGVFISLLAIVLAFATFPPGSGPNRGGLSAAPVLILLGTVIGGAITGIALSRKITRGWKRPRTIVFGLTCIGVVMTAIVIYGQYAAPRFFDASFVDVAYRTVLGFGGALLLLRELALTVVDKWRASG